MLVFLLSLHRWTIIWVVSLDVFRDFEELVFYPLFLKRVQNVSSLNWKENFLVLAFSVLFWSRYLLVLLMFRCYMAFVWRCPILHFLALLLFPIVLFRVPLLGRCELWYSVHSRVAYNPSIILHCISLHCLPRNVVSMYWPNIGIVPTFFDVTKYFHMISWFYFLLSAFA